MKQKDLDDLTDQELLDVSKKTQSNIMMNAVLIGFLIGILIYSILINSIGFFSLIPLFLIFKLLNNPRHNKDLDKLLVEQKLK
jgi:hypothetical protein